MKASLLKWNFGLPKDKQLPHFPGLESLGAEGVLLGTSLQDALILAPRMPLAAGVVTTQHS